MQGSSISKLVITFLAGISAIYVVFDVMASGGNVIGKLYSYALVASALFGLFSPKAAFIYLLILTAYIDYFKRLMILDSGIQMKDIYAILGIAPATLGGILASSVYGAMQGRKSLASGQMFWTLSLFVTIAVVIGLGLVTQGRSGRALGDTVNLAVYISMLAVVPLLFQTPAELSRLLKTLVIIYVPAGLYMIYHGFEGITDLEMEYVRSGLTIEIRQLSEEKFRPFGTMSSAGAASITFSVLAALVLTGPWGKRGDEGTVEVQGFGFTRLLVFGIFAAAAAFTLTRTGWVLGVVGLAGGLGFRYRSITQMVYAGTAAMGAFLVFGASWIMRSGLLDSVDLFLRGFSRSSAMDRQLTVLTFSDRLKSFQSFTDFSNSWTPLGWRLAGRAESQKPFNHDALTDSLLRFGYIPLGILGIAAMFGLFKMHQVILKEQSVMNRNLGAACAGAWLALAAGSLATSTQLYFFPINVFLWFFPAVIAGLGFYRKRNPYVYEPVSYRQPLPASVKPSYGLKRTELQTR